MILQPVLAAGYPAGHLKKTRRAAVVPKWLTTFQSCSIKACEYKKPFSSLKAVDGNRYRGAAKLRPDVARPLDFSPSSGNMVL